VVFSELMAAGRRLGLDPLEIPKTVLSGLASGKNRPFRAPMPTTTAASVPA
jgi:hypothetical protein